MPNPIRRKIGIVSALHQEQAGLLQAMTDTRVEQHGMRSFTSGQLWGIEVVCVIARIGKVAAATTVCSLIEHFGVTDILFTGVAGGVSTTEVPIGIGDIVVADQLIQYDMDARPLFPRFEVPLLGMSTFPSDKHLADQLLTATATFLACDYDHVIDAHDRQTLRLQAPRLHRGLIGSGDEFIGHLSRQQALKQALPDLLAVEMEGAAVAQVCFEFGVPFAVIRTISDNANEDSAVDFVHFIDKVASRYAFHIVRRWCELAVPDDA